MPTHSFLTDDFPGILIAAFLATLSLTIHFRLRQKRFNELQQLADRYHLAHVDTLPHDFPIDRLAKWGWLRTRDIFIGQAEGDTLLVMDTRVGYGRGSYTRTIVARRLSSPHSQPNLPGNLWYAEAKSWRIAFPMPGLFFLTSRMSPNLVLQVWNLLAGPDGPRLKLNRSPESENWSPSPHSTEILIHPRKPHPTNSH